MLERYSVVVIVCVPLNSYYSASFICSSDDGDFEFFFYLFYNYCIACLDSWLLLSPSQSAVTILFSQMCHVSLGYAHGLYFSCLVMVILLFWSMLINFLNVNMVVRSFCSASLTKFHVPRSDTCMTRILCSSACGL